MAEAAAPTQGDGGGTEDEAAGDGDNIDSDPGIEEEEAQDGGRRFRGLNFKKNGSALQTMHMRIVKLSTELALVLTTETGGRWTSTRLSDLAEELVALNDTYNIMKNQTQQKQDDGQRQTAEVATMNEDAVGSVMMTGAEYRALQSQGKSTTATTATVDTVGVY
ncbi:hypothetical protein KI688_002599 [Linnemannia hyalina]|uniref:Uncharacterized protein n=1 Tax=Linnemannia hyalina TaxID=64524 RepID=A0A9P8BRR9_9FUNG|nr:hypothetical protein KI688_002599 [Linnemannia hyalina]